MRYEPLQFVRSKLSECGNLTWALGLSVDNTGGAAGSISRKDIPGFFSQSDKLKINVPTLYDMIPTLSILYAPPSPCLLIYRLMRPRPRC